MEGEKMKFPKEGTIENFVAWVAIVTVVIWVLFGMAAVSWGLGFCASIAFFVSVLIFRHRFVNCFIAAQCSLAALMARGGVSEIFSNDPLWIGMLILFAACAILGAGAIAYAADHIKKYKLKAWQVYGSLAVEAGLVVLADIVFF